MPPPVVDMKVDSTGKMQSCNLVACYISRDIQLSKYPCFEGKLMLEMEFIYANKVRQSGLNKSSGTRLKKKREKHEEKTFKLLQYDYHILRVFGESGPTIYI